MIENPGKSARSKTFDRYNINQLQLNFKVLSQLNNLHYFNIIAGKYAVLAYCGFCELLQLAIFTFRISVTKSINKFHAPEIFEDVIWLIFDVNNMYMFFTV
ncbi:hypothetical protein CHUAL_005023 [Chamberlinius hualienensis]